LAISLLLPVWARGFYNPQSGRWLSRDPLGEVGGANLFGFVANHPQDRYDHLGLWNGDVHRDRTTQWAGELGISSEQAQNIGVFDAAIDVIYNPKQINNRNWSWHFNRSVSSGPEDDSRLKHRNEELAKAKLECTNPTDEPTSAAAYLGYALHPLQDWVAHADFNRYEETPSISIRSLYYWHNWGLGGWWSGWWTGGQPDDTHLDAPAGVDGRATRGVMELGTTLSNGDQIYWVSFQPGGQRFAKTEQLTKDLVADFQAYVRANAKPCGRCRKAFSGGN